MFSYIYSWLFGPKVPEGRPRAEEFYIVEDPNKEDPVPEPTTTIFKLKKFPEKKVEFIPDNGKLLAELELSNKDNEKNVNKSNYKRKMKNKTKAKSKSKKNQ